ncbi:hypothetical protein CP02DC14_2307, partial [Chlamydia psittaci 02DC14]
RIKPDQTGSDRLESVLTCFNQTKPAQNGFDRLEPVLTG